MNYSVISPSQLGTITITGTSNAVSMNIPRAVTYQFQVVEFTDKDNKVVKVELQVQQTQYDGNGNTFLTSGFQPVPRIKMPMP
jgi:hypothetical protein